MCAECEQPDPPPVRVAAGADLWVAPEQAGRLLGEILHAARRLTALHEATGRVHAISLPIEIDGIRLDAQLMLARPGADE